MEDQSKVFLSYSRENKDFAVRLAKQLKSEGFLIWLDRLDASLNARWDDQVEQALEECEIFMVIVTPTSITADNVQDEVGYALDTQKRILPLLLENPTLPAQFDQMRSVNFSNVTFEEGIASTRELLRNLSGQASGPQMESLADEHGQLGSTNEEPEPATAQQGEREGLEPTQVQHLGEPTAEERPLSRVQGEDERKVSEDIERIIAQKVEEQVAKAKADAERRIREEVERIVTQKVEEERIAKARADEERRIKEEAERVAAHWLEEERIAKIRADEERIIREQTERIAAQKVEEERFVRTKADTADRQESIPAAVVFGEAKSDSSFFSKKPASRGLVFGIASVVLLALAGVGFGVFSNRSTVIPSETPTSQPSAIPATAAATETEEVLIPVSSGPTMEVGSNYGYVDGSTLVAVPAGAFKMGGDGTDNPAHEVTLADYWIYSTEVTNQQYALCVKMGKCTPPASETNPGYVDYQRANDPITGVTYEQASNYCSFVYGRLPSEAEWEKAAQNLQGGKYPWGDTEPSCDLLNFNNCTTGTAHVVSYPKGASSYGAFDMSGNAFEWVSDWYDAAYYASSPGENPQGPETGTVRSVRSSSFASPGDQIAITTRSSEKPEIHRADLGFRCVVEEPTHFAPFCELPVVYTHTQQTNTSVCPEVGIKESPFCIGAIASTNVTFRGPVDATIDSKDCLPSEKPNLFTCQSPDTTVSISAKCEVRPPVGDPSCPDGYSQQNGVCIADAGSVSNACLTGTYDPATQCCRLPEDMASIPVCSVGTYYSVQQKTCLPYPVQETVTTAVKVSFATTCTVPSTGGNAGTSAPPK